MKNTITFELETEFIELNKLLKVTRIADTGGMANTLIVSGDIKLNGQSATEKRRKVRPGDVVDFQGIRIVVK